MRIIICYTVSKSSVSDYWTGIATELVRKGHVVNVVSWGGSCNEFQKQTGSELHFFPSRRPTKIKDFIFFYKYAKRKNADVIIANFGSTNVVMLVAKFLRIKHRCVYCHTLSNQIKSDSNASTIISRVQKLRRSFLMKTVTTFLCNSELLLMR